MQPHADKHRPRRPGVGPEGPLGSMKESDLLLQGPLRGPCSNTEPEHEAEPRRPLRGSRPLGLISSHGYRSSFSASRETQVNGPQGAVNRVMLWFGQLEKQYGERMLLLLFASQHLLKGLAMQFQASAILWVFVEYGVNGPRMQIYTSVAGSAWALKPVIGALSDTLPICGFRRAPYVILTSLIGVWCLAMIGLSSTRDTGVLVIVGLLFGMSLQQSTCDLLSEARYSEMLHVNPAYGPDLITFVWGGISVGGLIAISVVGWIISNFGPRAVFLACVAPSALVLFPAAANYFDEVRMTPDMVKSMRDAFFQQSEVLFLCFLMTVLTVLLAISGAASEDPTLPFFTAVAVLAILLPSFYVVLRPEIARVNTFFVLQAALSLNIGGATFYFYTDQAAQYPEGPHFSAYFFATTLGVASSLMSLLGLVVYTRHLRDWKYRKLLGLTSILMTLLSMLDVLMFTRTNLRFGISDSAFVLGSSACSVVIRQWQWMPGVVVLSQLCPRGMEATMFALLAGCSNVGYQVADNFGAFMLHQLDVRPTGGVNESAQFENLWKASLVSTFLPAAIIALIFVLIPDALQTDRLLVGNLSSATAGSLLSLWRGEKKETTARSIGIGTSGGESRLRGRLSGAPLKSTRGTVY